MNTNTDPSPLDETIRQLLAEHCDIAPESITPLTTLRELGLDSIAMLNLLIDLEERLGYSLTDPRMPANPCVRDVGAMARRNQAEA